MWNIVKAMSCPASFRCWEIIFTSHRYLLGCSGIVFTRTAWLPGRAFLEILFTSTEKLVDKISSVLMEELINLMIYLLQDKKDVYVACKLIYIGF